MDDQLSNVTFPPPKSIAECLSLLFFFVISPFKYHRTQNSGSTLVNTCNPTNEVCPRHKFSFTQTQSFIQLALKRNRVFDNIKHWMMFLFGPFTPLYNLWAFPGTTTNLSEAQPRKTAPEPF